MNNSIMDREQKSRIQFFLQHKFLPVIIACLSIILVLPSLKVGWHGDDWYMRMKFFDKFPIAGEDNASLFGLFSFITGDPDLTNLYMQIGLLPWWTYQKLKIQFLRPITELFHALDYWLWPDSAEMMHLHSILWLGALVFVVAILYRRFLGVGWAAGLAIILYVIDDAHSIPVAWLANRNSLIATFFGVLSLIMHDKWRRENWKPGAIIGPLCLAIGLLSSEFASGVCAYLFAYAVVFEKKELKTKIFSLIPYIIVGFIWWMLYKSTGFGAYGSGLYIDPGQEPLQWIVAIIERAPILLLGQLGYLPPFYMFFLPEQLQKIWVFAIIFIFFVFLLMIPMIRRNITSRFWVIGMLFALLPVCATIPDTRLLLFVSLGGMGVISQFFYHWFKKSGWLRDRLYKNVLARIFLALFVIIHLIIAPLLMQKIIRFDQYLPNPNTINHSITYYVFTPDSENEILVCINPVSSFLVQNIRILRQENGLPVHMWTRSLADCNQPISVTRVDEKTLVLQPKNGFIFSMPDKMVRGSSHPMKVSEKVVLYGMTAEVLSITEDNRPEKVKFTFDVPLEDKQLKFVEWRYDMFVEFQLPAIGTTVILPKIKIPLFMR